MSQDTMDRVVKVGEFKGQVEDCKTDGYILDGGEGWQPTSFIRLIQDYGIEIEVRVQCNSRDRSRGSIGQREFSG